MGTVQQMFGRAGRIGAGEDQGWAFMIVDEHERAGWQSRLVAGHTVNSRIKDSLPEQLLSEAVQQLVSSQRQAEQWWVQTLAFHQGQRSLRPLSRGIQFLVSAGMLTASPARSGDVGLSPTELGRLTARLMVSPVIGDSLRHALARAPVPAGPAGSVLAVWAGKTYLVTPLRRGHAVTEQPALAAGAPGAAVFTWRGDYRATGWLATYSQIPG